MKKLHLLLALIFIPALLRAQGSISGNVSDSTNNPLPFATISLTDANHAIAASVTADDKGIFLLNVPGSFTSGQFTVHYIGYASFTKLVLKSELPLSLEITLAPQQTELKEITLNARQNAVTMKDDKMIYNIEKAGIGNGNNGIETMRLIPGMRLDKDENLIFRGSGNIQIMINGKKSLLQGDALREYIRSLKGTDIESVEIIAQPSARYEATGTAGIINIVLKKDRKSSLSGSAYSSVAYGEYFKQQYGGRLYYNDLLWNINGNTSYYDGKSVNHRHVKQTIALDEGTRILDQHNEWLPVTISKSLNVAVERKLGKNQLISTEWQYYNSDADEKTYGTTKEFLNNAPVNTVKLTQHIMNPEERVTGNLFYNFTSDSTTTKLDAQANFARYTTGAHGFQRNEYSSEAYMQLNGSNNTAYTIATGQLDLNRQLNKKMNLEAGIKYSFVDMDYYNDYDTNNSELLFIPDSLLVNDFRYREHLASAYSQVSINLKNWSFLAGLRAEYYNYTATSLINRQQNTDSYLNLFPSFSANYKMNNHQYQLSYSRRIGRPNYLSLNPYYQYIDAYTLEQGNPALKPQFYNSFQLSYVYRSALSISLYGYTYKNGFTSVINYLEAENYNVTYQANASKGNRFGLSASLPYEANNWWSMQLSIDAAYASESSKLPEFTYNGSGFGYDISLYENVKLKKDWQVTMNAFYTGRATTANGYSRATYDFSLSAKKSLLDKKLQLLGGCSNILKKSFYNHVTQVNNVSTDWTNRWETRRFYFQLTYYFGGGKSKNIKSASLSDETERIQ